jgi:hypothetical protein
MDSYNKRIVLFVFYVVNMSCAVRQVYKDTIKPNISPYLKTLKRNTGFCEINRETHNGYD